MSLVEQELLTVPKHLNSPPVFGGILIVQSLIYCIVFCRSLFVLSIYGFWLPLWYLKTLLKGLNVTYLDIKGQSQIRNYAHLNKWADIPLPLVNFPYLWTQVKMQNKAKRRWEKVPLILKEPIPSLRDSFASCNIPVTFSAAVYPWFFVFLFSVYARIH